MTNFFEQLQAETETSRDDFLSIPVVQQGAKGAINLATYTTFLEQAYHHVKHTVPLLMACGSKLSGEYEWLREAIGHYIEEEMGHQEWILNDLRACGVDAEKVRNGKPHPSTEIMVAYAYDIIHRNNPVGFFGMVLVLEGMSILLASNAADSIQSSLELPDSAFSYLSSHGALDISHMEFFTGLMNRLEKKVDKDAVIHSANVIYHLYGNIFRNLPFDVQKNIIKEVSHV